MFRIHITDVDGRTILLVETKSLGARKASYIVYAGGKYVESENMYGLKVDLLSGGSTVSSAARSVEIER